MKPNFLIAIEILKGEWKFHNNLLLKGNRDERLEWKQGFLEGIQQSILVLEKAYNISSPQANSIMSNNQRKMYD